MLTHTLNNRNIPLPLEFSQRITIKTPVFSFDRIPFSYSLDFSLPMTDEILAIFEHPNRVTKRRLINDQQFTGYEIRFDGALFMRGTLSVYVSGNTLSCTLVDLLGELTEAEQERSILDILKFMEEIDFENSNNYSPDTHPYCCFPVINPGFFKDKGIKVKKEVYANVPGEGLVKTDETYETEILTYLFNKSVASRVNALNEDGTIKKLPSDIAVSGTAYETGEVSVITPFFFLNYIIKEALKESNFHIIENYINDHPELRKICLYNNYDITSTYYGVGLFDLYEQFSFLNPNDGNQLIVDYSSAGKQIVNYVRSYPDKIIIKNHLPKMTFGDLLLSTQNTFNLCFDFLPNATVNVFSREDLLTRVAIDINKYLIGEMYPGIKENTAINFIRSTDNNDQVFTERWIDLNDRRKDIKAPVTDWTALLATPSPVEGDIRFVITSNKYCEYKWSTQTYKDFNFQDQTRDVLGWEEISISLQNGWYEFGRKNTKDIKTNWGTCYSAAGNTLVNQQGNQNSWRAAKQSFSPRLLIYAGNNQGGNEVENLSFEYEKEDNGLIEKCWKNTVRMLSDALPMVGNFDFPVNVIRSLIYNKCLPYRTNEASFLIDEISFDMYSNKIGTVELKVFKRD